VEVAISSLAKVQHHETIVSFLKPCPSPTLTPTTSTTDHSVSPSFQAHIVEEAFLIFNELLLVS
jgi:hypothetical protein